MIAGGVGTGGHVSLTLREAEIVLLVQAGWTNRQIAAKYGCKETTVKVHIGRIYRKFGVRPERYVSRGRTLDVGKLQVSP